MTLYILNLAHSDNPTDWQPIAICDTLDIATELAVEYAAENLWLEYDGQGTHIKQALMKDYEYSFENIKFAIYSSELNSFID